MDQSTSLSTGVQPTRGTRLDPGDPRSGPLPDFVVIGAMKSGSTTLWRYLRDHPDVFMTDPKELHFFVEDRNWGRGVDWYRSQFRPGRHLRVRGEASVTYTQAPRIPGVPARMAGVVPNARLVYLVREPVARMRSHFVHELAALREDLPIERALLEHPKYLDASRYASQLDLFLEHYPAEQVLVVTSEALWRDPAAAVGRVLAFLGVPPADGPRAAVHVNRSEHKSVPGPVVHRLMTSPAARAVARRVPVPLREAVKARAVRRPIDARATALPDELAGYLRSVLADEVERLRRLAGEELDAWTEKR